MTTNVWRTVPATVEQEEEEMDCNEWNRTENAGETSYTISMNTVPRSVSPPVESVIDSFNQELDNLTKSLDEALSVHAQRRILIPNRPFNGEHDSDFSLQDGQNRSSHNLVNDNIDDDRVDYNHLLPEKNRPQMQDPDPPSERLSPLRSNSKNNLSHLQDHRRKNAYTPAEPPPAPVQTPGFPRFDTHRRNRAGTDRDTGLRLNQKDDACQEEGSTTSETINRKGWEGVLEKMRQTLCRQDERIRELEKENTRLRQELTKHQRKELPREDLHASEQLEPNGYRISRGDAIFQKMYEEDPDAPRTSGAARRAQRDDPSVREIFKEPNSNMDRVFREKGHTGLHRNFREEPLGHIPTSTSMASSYRSPARNRSPPRRTNTLNSATFTEDTAFSPGTQFVSELARLMKLEGGHQAPLSVLIDRHWDKLRDHFENNQSYS